MNETTRIPRDLAAKARDAQSDAEWDEAGEWAKRISPDPDRRSAATGWRFWLHVINFPEAWAGITLALFGLGVFVSTLF